MKKLLLVISLVGTIITGCGQKKEVKGEFPTAVYKVTAEAPGYEISRKDPVTIDWYINFSWFNEKWGESLVTQMMQEDTGVKINFTSGDDKKLNALIASDSLPDIVTLEARNDLSKSPNIEKLALPLNVLAEKYDPYFFKVAKNGVIKWQTLKDGNMYGYSNFALTPEDFTKEKIFSNEVFIVRKDIYEALGKPDMTTKEGFLDTLKQVKEKYPEINGKSIIPLGFEPLHKGTGEGSLTGTLQRFLGLPNEVEGAVYDKKLDKEYLAWLKVIREAIKNGYVGKDNFSDIDEKINEKLSQGRYFAYITDVQMGKGSHLNHHLNNEPEGQYIAIDGPRNFNGAAPKLWGTGIGGWTVTFISKKAKNPERIIQLFTYMISQKAQQINFFGKEGETFEFIHGKPEIKPEVLKSSQENPSKFAKEIGIGNMWMFGDKLYESKYRNILPSLVQPISYTYGKTMAEFELTDIDPRPNTQEGKALQRIKTKWEEILPALLLTKDDTEFNSTLKEYAEFREKNNWDQILKIMNENMVKNKEKLGIK